jgi:putative PIN family toxin of toxin-antitoxin system
MKRFLKLFRENRSRYECFDCGADRARVVSRANRTLFLNHSLVTSEFILNEIKEKLVGKSNFSSEIAEEAVALFRTRMEIVTPEKLSSPVCRDPDDDNILATAAAGNCAHIITGDKDLLALEQFGETKILSPRAFAEQESFG